MDFVKGAPIQVVALSVMGGFGRIYELRQPCRWSTRCNPVARAAPEQAHLSSNNRDRILVDESGEIHPLFFLGMFTRETALANLYLAPIAIVGTLLGVLAHSIISERVFFFSNLHILNCYRCKAYL